MSTPLEWHYFHSFPRFVCSCGRTKYWKCRTTCLRWMDPCTTFFARHTCGLLFKLIKEERSLWKSKEHVHFIRLSFDFHYLATSIPESGSCSFEVDVTPGARNVLFMSSFVLRLFDKRLTLMLFLCPCFYLCVLLFVFLLFLWFCHGSIVRTFAQHKDDRRRVEKAFIESTGLASGKVKLYKLSIRFHPSDMYVCLLRMTRFSFRSLHSTTFTAFTGSWWAARKLTRSSRSCKSPEGIEEISHLAE